MDVTQYFLWEGDGFCRIDNTPWVVFSVSFLRRSSSSLSLVAVALRCEEVTLLQSRFSHACHRLQNGIFPTYASSGQLAKV